MGWSTNATHCAFLDTLHNCRAIGGVGRALSSTASQQPSSASLTQQPRPRAPKVDEKGIAWIKDSADHRPAILAAETAVVVANYLRLLGHEARAQTMSSTDVDLNRLTVASGVAKAAVGRLLAPFIGEGFSLAVVTTKFPFAEDLPLAELPAQLAPNYAERNFEDGLHPFESLNRVDKPTTYIDEVRVPRVPKRTDMFSRVLYGDLGKNVQDGAKGGLYVRKSAPSLAQRRAWGAFMLLQDGAHSNDPHQIDPQEAHDQAISMIIDQGYDTIEGPSCDDWIAVAMSLRANCATSATRPKHIR